ncbi:sugar transferase [Pontibacter oryzae]|uniref:Sugar transferase n=2 Tax=Pontibacter oryzae TaxID=2304593 RepID=A0A399SMI1_9BACT|nr:sugar transferase [Pontibacter oryzae]
MLYSVQEQVPAQSLRKHPYLRHLPVIMLSESITPALKSEALKLGADDLYQRDGLGQEIFIRIQYLVKKHRLLRERKRQQTPKGVKTPVAKRILDILISGTALLLLLPVLSLVALCIKLDSKGPVLYLSKRVGAGYKVFNLYKFRTMRTGADKDIAAMADANMYTKKGSDTAGSMGCPECARLGHACSSMLYISGKQMCERTFLSQKNAAAAFMKFQNDPRITRLGLFLRNTSLDELPQLFNIFLGDMSLVGNRPLPLYEAEKLTTDEYIQRFAAPAGLTGLWQVTKRGKGDLSEEERIQLDIEYAHTYSFWGDVKLILRTFPALLQTENV